MNKQRIEYLDAMRGFAMFLVVVGHVILFSFTNVKCNNVLYNTLNNLLQIPLFFMISGFFCDVTLKKFTVSYAIRNLSGKIIMLLVAPVVFGSVFCWLKNHLVLTVLFDNYKYGYWFTIALFVFIAIYYVSWLIIKMFRLSDKWSLAILLASGIALMFVGMWFTRVQNSYRVIGLFGAVHLTNYVYFVIGIICHRHINRLYKLLNNSILMGGGIAILMVGLIYMYNGDTIRYIGSFTTYTFILTTLALFVVFATFKRYPQLSTDSVPGRWLSFIGRRTLDVYFLHYFFLPRHLQVVGQWADTYNNPLLVYVAAMAIAALVTAAALALGSIIRLSPMLGKLLGAK